MSFIPIQYNKGDKVWTWVGKKDGYHIIHVTIAERCEDPASGDVSYCFREPDGEPNIRNVAYLFPHKAQAVAELRKYLLRLADGCRFNIQQNIARTERFYKELQIDLEELSKLEDINTDEDDK